MIHMYKRFSLKMSERPPQGLRGVVTSRAQIQADSRNAEGCGIRIMRA